MLLFAGLNIIVSIELTLVPKDATTFYPLCEDLCRILRATLLSNILYTFILAIGELIFYFSRDAKIGYLLSMGCICQLIG